MLRSIACLFVLAVWCSLAAGSDLLIRREFKDEPERGAGYVRKDVGIVFPQGSIRYSGVARNGSKRGISEEYGDQVLGLSWCRPPGTNGGWDLASFLQVNVKSETETFDATRRFLLDDVHLLENGGRTMLQFVWPLDEAGDGKLVVTTAQYPSHPEWLFVRVRLFGEAVEVSQVLLSCFPGNTAGPAERQRWIATASGSVSLHDGNVKRPPAEPAIAYFNRNAHPTAGCFLVYDPEPIQGAEIGGTYGIRTHLMPRPGQRELRFALGGFVDQPVEEAVRYFIQERADGARSFLSTINWTPRIDHAAHEKLLAQTEQLAREVGDQKAVETLCDMRRAYAKARSAQDITTSMTLADQFRHRREELYKKALKQWE